MVANRYALRHVVERRAKVMQYRHCVLSVLGQDRVATNTLIKITNTFNTTKNKGKL